MATNVNRPKVGDKAPMFSAVDQKNNQVSLTDFADKKLILYFYPKDNTSGCTAQACSLRDGRDELRKMGFEIVGVSPDSIASHQKFIEKQSLNFTLLSDPDHSIAESYGVWGEKKFMGRTYNGIYRTTFIIINGVVDKVFDKVDTKNHFDQIVDAYKQ